jgi:hypothetical protein
MMNFNLSKVIGKNHSLFTSLLELVVYVSFGLIDFGFIVMLQNLVSLVMGFGLLFDYLRKYFIILMLNYC